MCREPESHKQRRPSWNHCSRAGRGGIFIASSLVRLYPHLALFVNRYQAHTPDNGDSGPN